MIDNAKGSRNLNDSEKFELTIIRKELLKELGKNNLKIPTGSRNRMTLSLSDKVIHNTQKIIADELGWSTGKVASAEYVRNKAGIIKRRRK